MATLPEVFFEDEVEIRIGNMYDPYSEYYREDFCYPPVLVSEEGKILIRKHCPLNCWDFI